MSQTLTQRFAEAMAEKAEASTPSTDETASSELAGTSGDTRSDEGLTASDEAGEPQKGGEAATEDGERRYTPATLAEQMGWSTQEFFEGVEIPLSSQLATHFGKPALTLGELKDKLVAMDETLTGLNQTRQRMQQQQVEAEQYHYRLVEALQAPTEQVIQSLGAVEAIKLDFGRQDWEAIRRSGREVAEIKQQYAVALAQAKEALAKAQQEQQNIAKQNQQQMARWHFDRLRNEPEFAGWNTQEKFNQGMTALNKFAVNMLGFQPQELAGVVHHKAIKALWYAAHGWQMLHQQEQAKKAVRAAPKPVMKPGGGQGSIRQDAKLQEIVKRGQRTGATKQEKIAAVRAAVAKQQMQSKR